LGLQVIGENKMDIGTVIAFVFLGAIVGFILGCVYSDAHWQPIVKEYKKAIAEYKKIF
jgi:hypothetical protein